MERMERMGKPVHGTSHLPTRTIRTIHTIRAIRLFFVMQPDARMRGEHARRAIELFNSGAYWEAHEALEAIWRAVGDEDEARVLQGLIQAAAALLHRERGNRHGVETVGRKAMEKLAGSQHPAVEFETVEFRAALERALLAGAAAPRLELRRT